jgi:hypothetical protein
MYSVHAWDWSTLSGTHYSHSTGCNIWPNVSLDCLGHKFLAGRIEWLPDDELLQRSVGIEVAGMEKEYKGKWNNPERDQNGSL